MPTALCTMGAAAPRVQLPHADLCPAKKNKNHLGVGTGAEGLRHPSHQKQCQFRRFHGKINKIVLYSFFFQTGLSEHAISTPNSAALSWPHFQHQGHKNPSPVAPERRAPIQTCVEHAVPDKGGCPQRSQRRKFSWIQLDGWFFL